MTTPSVLTENLHKVYNGNFTAVEDLSFSIDDGEVLGIIGPNGAGKTTTLKMTAGLIEPTDGNVQISGISEDRNLMQSKIGFLPEESPVYDKMTAHSYLKFFADLYDIDKRTAKERMDRTLTELDLEHRDRNIGSLSKGMTRKVLIARSLINDPDVLIYDEPASGLDPATTNYIINYIAKLADRGKSIIFSAHNLYHVESLCDKVIILNNGEVAARGTLQEIRENHGEQKYDIVLDDRYPGAERRDEVYRKRVDSTEDVDEIRKEIDERDDINVIDVYSVEPSLEDVFLDLINIKNNESDTE